MSKNNAKNEVIKFDIIISMNQNILDRNFLGGQLVPSNFEFLDIFVAQQFSKICTKITNKIGFIYGFNQSSDTLNLP